jgi:hypothetical protein
MAYLNFREAELSGSLHSALRPIHDAVPAVDQTVRFSALEWLVVALAERDSLSSLRTPGRIGTALARLFGSSERRLANPQLEALRRLAVHAWHHGHNVPPSELAAFRAAGFSTGQAETLLDNILGRRGSRRARRFA